MLAWVFVTDEGHQITHSNFRRRVFEPLLTNASLRKIRFHDLRHMFASLLLQQGESPHYVKEQIGHHSIQVTVDIYGHLIPGANRKAVDCLDDRNPRKCETRKSSARKSLQQPAATSALSASLRIATVYK
jgi:site-specific recombinase XerD